MSHIVRLEATNYKRLRAVDITPERHLNVIAGRNAQGKTSVLDAITAALGGVDNKATPRPIHDGALAAEIVLETEELIVTRTFTASGSKVVVKGKDGALHTKGQAKLNSLLGRLSLDPLGFTQLDAKAQQKTLLDLVDLPFDLGRLEDARAAAFELRADVNRDAKALAGQMAGYPTFDVDNDYEEVSVADLFTQIEAARALERDYEADVRDHAESAARVRQAKQALADAEARLIRTGADLERWNDVAIPDVAALRGQIDSAETINAQARQYTAYLAVVSQHADKVAEAADLTAKIQKIDTQKADGLKKATFPVEGLGFDAEGITYNGVPFKQASGAEQLRVSLAMAIALNPGLRVIRIADGSLLDNDSLQLVEDMAVKHDFQVWVEMVSDTGDFGIVIEDGAVA